MHSTHWLVVFFAVILIGGGAWWYVSSLPVQEGTVPPQGQPIPGSTVGSGTEEGAETGGNVTGGVDVSVGAGSAAPMNATVTYTDAGFSPATVTIRKGGTITWVNQSSGNMWVASAQHPTHTAYSGTSRQDHCGTAQESAAFDQCRGEDGDWSFTFSKAGEWAYHDHINSSRFGRIEVVE